MTRDVRKRAFDPFFTTKGSLANGLGLSVAYGIVRRHGGRIELESAPGQGTRVRVKVPSLATPSLLTPVDVPSVAPRAHGSVRVLLVEDDADNRDAMAELLRLGGHVVTAAETGVDGVRRFARDAFDLVVTDLGLPDMTGWDVAREVKELSASTPVALVTGWGLNLASDEIRRRGVDLLIRKPIEPRKFLAQLAQLARSGREAQAG
jgi:CheY-like chemotaxis protein